MFMFKVLVYSVMVFFSSSNEVKERINESIKKLFHTEKDGTSRPVVCLVCDTFTGPNYSTLGVQALEKRKEYLEADVSSKLGRALKASYCYEGEGKAVWMENCLLSKRGIFIRNKGFILCNDCRACLIKNNKPRKGIANGFSFGSPPKELLNLNEAELAMITPTKSFGYCFTFIGGRNRKLKGTLGYYKVKKEQIGRVASVAHKLSQLLNSEVVFILFGELTEEQKELAQKRFQIRPEKVMLAIKWLVANNEKWKGVDLGDLEPTVQKKSPIILDLSKQAPELDPALRQEEKKVMREKESEMSLAVYFPDGTMTNVYGGQESARDFERAVCEAQSKGFDGTVVSSLDREFTNDYVNDNFVDSCLLQFPYGRGGVEEPRTTGTDDYMEWKMELSEYAQHLSKISEPVFHNPMFVLKLFNMKLRAEILRNSCQKLNGDASLWDLRNNLSMLDFSSAVQSKYSDSRSSAGNPVSRQLLRCLESVQRSLPHTDAAARRARQWMDSLQHHFGLGGVFLTVTPDDENSFLVSAYAGHDCEGNPINIDSLTAEELNEKSKLRKNIRINFPGITALNFEFILDIVIREVIGWDVKKGEPTEKPGLFGRCIAFGGAVEEQGRTSLHVHFIIWLEGFKDYLDSLSSNNTRTLLQSERHISEVVDNSISTELMTFDHYDDKELSSIFDHNCKKPVRSRKRPIVSDAQQLRNLRHKDGHKNDPTFARCPDCDKQWTSEDMVLDYLTGHKKLRKLETFPDNKNYLDSVCYEYTKPGYSGSVNCSIIHANKDHHLSRHVSTCFKNSMKKRKATTALKTNECRMRKPEEKRLKTGLEHILFGESNIVKYYSWTGKETDREFFQVVPKRNEYDLFMNNYVPAIGESKIGGNSNARIVTPGPIGMYTVKYPTKNTQHENEKPYDPVLESLTVALNNQPRHENDRAESLRLVIRGGFVANKTNIIGSSQASFLTRHRSRFVWSHEFAYVPLQDLMTLLTKGKLDRFYVKSYKGKAFADVQGLHYLCRPDELVDLSPKAFFEQYEVVGADVQNRRDELIGFKDTQYFQHPTNNTNNRNPAERGMISPIPDMTSAEPYNESQKGKMQFVRRRYKEKLAWVGQYNFTDAAALGGDILTSAEISQEMENYSYTVLALCHNYRCIDDLQINNSFVLKLRQLFINGSLSKHHQFLQNIQDSAHNFGRVRPTEDHLQSVTEPFVPPKKDDEDLDDCDAECDESPYLQGVDLDTFLDTFEQNLSTEQEQQQTAPDPETRDPDFLPKSINLIRIQKKGAFRCGTEQICRTTVERRGTNNNSEFIATTTNATVIPTATEERSCQPPRKPSREILVNVILTKKGMGQPRRINFSDQHIEFPQASGTALSIANWARIAKLDKNQRRAFEVFAASFVLSFFRDAEQGENREGLRDQTFLREKLRLAKLAGRIPTNATRGSRYKHENLICFLHGPGGSGKSSVLDLLLIYAEEYCGHVGEIFTKNTIVVTALSGVAATLINGRTIHSAVHINKKIENIPRTEKEEWLHARLLIIDEISFASQSDITKIEERVKYLKDNISRPYGGIDVIFCGDLRQLEPVGGGATLYDESFASFHGAVNCYLELHGTHRFSDDPDWGLVLMRFRDGKLTNADIDLINTRVAKEGKDLPPDLNYATYRNIDRASINAGVFNKYCRDRMTRGEDIKSDCIMVLSSDLEIRKGNKTYKKATNQWEQFFWQNCGEGDCHPQEFSGRFDPALLLYYNRPMMVNNNEDVGSGVAKGTRAYISKIHLKAGRTIAYTKIGPPGSNIEIPVVRASHIARIAMRHESDGTIFFVEPKKAQTFMATVPYPDSLQVGGGKTLTQKLYMRGTQLPIICNNATTGHKLQGATIASLFVHSWSNVRNWTYVVLSRVKTLKGLHLRRKLEKKNLHLYNHIPEQQKELIHELQQLRMQQTLSDSDYESILGDDAQYLSPCL